MAEPEFLKIVKDGQIARITLDRPKHNVLNIPMMNELNAELEKIAADKDVFDAIEATFPAGTLSGAPKIRAMQIIDELEASKRGIYGGAIGYVSFTKNTDLAITIRTAIQHGNKIIVQAGAGIVYNSEPELEYKECKNKAKGLIKAIEESV